MTRKKNYKPGGLKATPTDQKNQRRPKMEWNITRGEDLDPLVVQAKLDALETFYKAQRAPLRALMRVLLVQEREEELVGAEGVED